MMLRAIGRRWFEALALGLVLGAIFAAAVWNFRPDKYTSFSVLQIASAQQKLLSEATPAADYDNTYMKTQMAHLKSRRVFRAALNNEAVRQLPILLRQQDPIEWLEKELKVEQIESTELVRVSLTVRDPGADLAAILNAVVAAYIALIVEKEDFEKQNNRYYEIELAFNKAEKKVLNSQEEVNNLAQSLKSGDSKVLAHRQQLSLDECASLQREIANIKTRERELDISIEKTQNRLKALKSIEKGTGGPLDVLVDKELDADPRVREKELELSGIQALIKQYEEKSVQTESTYKQNLDKRLTAAKEALSKLRDELRGAALARQKVVYEMNLIAGLAEEEQTRALLQKQQKEMQNYLDTLKEDLSKLGISSVTLELKRAEHERNQQFLKMIGDQKERIELEREGTKSRRPRVMQLGMAEPASVMNKFGRMQEAAGAGLFGLCLGALAVGYRDLRRGKIYSPTDVSRGLRMNVIGSLPSGLGTSLEVPGTEVQSGPAAGQYFRGLTESIDEIRTMLLHDYMPGRCRFLMVTSAIPKEGKSTLSVELAASLARANCRTLLIDGDLRNPSLHQVFDTPMSPGFCEMLARNDPHSGLPVTQIGDDAADCDVISKSAAIDEVIFETRFTNLHLLPAGKYSFGASSGMAQHSILNWLFSDLRSRYDFIILDSSPVLLVPDALMMARHTDGVVLSVMQGVSQTTEVYDMARRLSDYRLPLVGVVFSGVPAKKSYNRQYGNRSNTGETIQTSA